jgi:hypothetical protein
MVSQSEVKQALEEAEPGALDWQINLVAEQMTRLLDSGKLRELENTENTVDYVVSRLEVREGDDNPDIITKWNYWVGEMEYFNDGMFERYKVDR